MEKRKSQTMMKKLIACSIAVIMCMVTCLAPLGVSAASDLMVPATFYTEAYNATNGSNKLDVDSTGLVLRQGDWIKYGINIAEAGVYNVSMDVLVDGTRTQNYKVSLDDVVKIENGSGLVEAGGWKTIELGTINITKSGAQTLKIENIGYWSYVRSIKLTYVSGINYDIEIPVTKYAEGYKASDGSGTLQADGTSLVMSNGDWAKYNIDVLKEGQYKVTLDALVDGARTQSFAVALNDAVKIENASVLVEAGGWKNIELGTISITKTGAQTLKLTSTGTYWTYANNLKLVYVGELNYDIEIPVKTYTEGYKASDGSGALQADGAALVMSNGDWAKYNIDVLKEGQYKVTLDALVDGARNQSFSVALNDVTKIENATTLVETGGYKNIEVGILSITESGNQTITLTSTGTYWVYAKNLKLTYVGELNYDIEISMKSYVEGYKASDGSGTLQTDGDALVFNQNDWAKYNIEALKAGQYKITLDALVDGTRNFNCAVSVDGITKLSNATVLVEAGGYKNIELGTINITKEGIQTLKIENNGFWAYTKNLKLTYVGELNYDIEISMKSYVEGYKASDGSGTLQTDGDALVFNQNDWAKYNIEALKAGQYKITLDALVDGTRNFDCAVSVDGITKLSNATVLVEAGGYKNIELGTINMTKEGIQTLKIENIGLWAYTKNLKLTYVGELNYDIEIPMASYCDGYNAANGSGTLSVADDALILYQDDWAKYNVDVLKAGKYNISIDILVDGERYQKYTISADNTLKNLYTEVLSTPSGYKNYNLGSIYFKKSGLQTLKFENEGFWGYVKNLKLSYAGELNEVTVGATEQVIINATDYIEGYDKSENLYDMIIDNNNVCFGSGDWAEYIIDAKAEGIYNVKTAGSACDTDKALVNVSANGKLYSSQDFGNSFSEADNYVYLEKGINVLKIENPGENDFDLRTLTLSRVGGMTSAGGTEQSVDADFSEVLAQGERLAFGINADANGVYKIRALINDSAKTDVNVYVNDVPVSVISIPYSETDSEYYAFVRLDSGKNIIKLKALDGDVDIDDIKVAFQTSATDEELDEVSLNVQNAKNEDEIKAILSESSAVLGADIETLTNGIQYEKYVYTRLLGRTYTVGTDLLDAIYNTVAFEKATPSLATSVSGGVLKAIALTDIYESDGMIIAAIYKDGRMLGMNASPYVRGEKADVTVSGYIDGATIKVFSVDSLNSISPIEISGGIYRNIYVSSSAELNGNGTELNPYRSLKEAKLHIKELGGSQTGDIVVNIMPGYYELAETEVFTEADGANGDNKIIYRGTDKENMPIISGGTKVTGWSHVGNGIYSANFSGENVRNLYVGGYPAQRARSNRAYTLSSQNGNTMNATINDISSFAKPSDLVLVWPCEWAMHYTPVENVSISNGEATFSMDDIFSWKTRSDFTDIGGYHSKLFYIENALELLDSEGEFYYDKSAGKIYYKPFAEEDLNDCYASVLDAMMEIEGTSEESKASNIVFENLDFRYGSWNNNAIKHVQSDQYITNASGTEYAHIPAQISINYADNISFENCRFSCMGSTAIAMRDAATNISMSGNIFKDLGGGAVSIGSFDHNYEATEGDNCSQIKFTDNVVRRTSQVYGGVPALAIYYENNIEILRNDISDLPYTAISAGWGWGAYSGKAGELTISKNRIYGIMDSLNDGAHIYTLGDLSGTVISENYMYGTGDGRGGVYNDTGSAGMDILSNVIDVYIPSKDTYWWVLNQLLIKNINAHGNFAHSSGDIYESAIAQNVTQSDNNNIKGNGSWDGLGNEKAQSIIDNAGISASYSSLLDLANTPSWRNDPTALN